MHLEEVMDDSALMEQFFMCSLIIRYTIAEVLNHIMKSKGIPFYTPLLQVWKDGQIPVC